MAAQLGYCGLDRHRQPLRGDEIRACWESLAAPGEASPPPSGAATAWPLEPGKDRTAVRLLEFIEVRADVGREGRDGPAVSSSAAGPDGPRDAALNASAAEPGWSLWGDAEA